MIKNTKKLFILLYAMGSLFLSHSLLAAGVAERRLSDGVWIKVHFTSQQLAQHHVGEDFPYQVLDAASSAYELITRMRGFNTPGFTFSKADRKYAYDPDQTIDIYLGSPDGENSYPELGSKNRMFRDAPCFDVIHESATRYQAVILLPVNYREFIENWEKMNPSPMGERDIRTDLRGTLTHEMLHVVLFYYNKNLNKSAGSMEASPAAPRDDLDWYVEGLARYFETLAGARHDFYSQGFKQTLPDKVRFSRGGANYFMRYPDQPFTRLRYENALFWRFIEQRHGMETIERLSRLLRHRPGFKAALEEVTGRPFDRLLQEYALSVIQKDFNLKKDSSFLNDVARTRLSFGKGNLSLLDGAGHKKFLGKICATDWVGKWENSGAEFGSPSIAGDSTDQADLSPWATDFYEISMEGDDQRAPDFELHSKNAALRMQVLPALDRTYLLVTNTDPVSSATYEWRVAEFATTR